MDSGKVKWFNPKKGYGFIETDDGIDVFVHYSDLQMPGKRILREGQIVKFSRVQGPKGTKACSVVITSPDKENCNSSPANRAPFGSVVKSFVRDKGRVNSSEKSRGEIQPDTTDSKIVSEDLEQLNTGSVSKNILLEISRWKREAKSEDNDRYFWHVREVDEIDRGDKYFVIGRKGSGKTAISEYYNRKQEHGVFTEKLTFKNFPFNELYSHKNKKYTPPNQFITLWKYLIYSTVCRLMLRNEGVDITIREQLAKIYGQNTSLQRRVGEWVGKEFGVSLFGLCNASAEIGHFLNLN